MTFLAASTMGEWPIIGWFADLFGIIMRGIFIFLSNFGLPSITLCIILFTIITRMLLLPLTIQQQKFSKLSAVMNPELQALQKKYAGKRDQASMQRMQLEQQLSYDKYGVSMTAGCLPSLIQIPLLFALYPVVYNFEHYVKEFATYTAEQQTQMYTFLGMNLKDTPHLGLNLTMLIPILAGVTQFISTQLMMANQPQTSASEENSLARSMKTMNYTMPLMSVFFCFTFPAFIGIYWITMSVVMVVQQIFINNWLKKLDVEEMIRKNVEKKNAKRAKKGLPPIGEKALVATRKINNEVQKAAAQKESQASKVDQAVRDAKIKESTDYYNGKSAKPGSLAAKANMVKEYNEKHSKK